MRVPTNIKEALREGWKVVGEETGTTPDERKRTGVVFLAKDHKQIAVPYVGTRAGFTFDAPRVKA